MKNEIGLKHISLELNISIVAVSRALKDYDDISEVTKHKVRQKAIELGYMPKPVAKSKFKTIALFIDSLTSSILGVMAEKLIAEFKKYNYLVILIPTAKNHVYKENVKEALELSVDGMISFLVPCDNAYEIALLHRIPFLLLGRYDDKPKLNVVYMDDYMGGEVAASYLIEQGADKLCYVGVNYIECSKRRQQGFFDKGHNEGVNDIQVVYDSEIEKVVTLIKTGYKWFFCFDDNLANYLLNFHKENDIHVVGFNGTSRFSLQFEFIPSIDCDYDEMVKDAVRIIIDKINNKNNSQAVVKKHNTKLCI